MKRILTLAGYAVTLGKPGTGDLVGIWGMSPTAHRGEAVASHTGVDILRVEDPWLRSLKPGRAGGDGPIGLLLDRSGVHFDPATPSDLERILSDDPLDDTALLNRARGAIERLKETALTKYTGYDPDLAPPAPGYVLVIDQTQRDASVTASGADRNRFLEMLYYAQDEHPGARIILKSHPETAFGLRDGHFTQADCTAAHISRLTAPVSPWALLEGAIAVYTVSSQLGFEAIFAGHKPRVFGQPFYAGWGLTEDAFPVQRRQRRLTRAQLFAAAMLLYPTWYDPNRDRLCRYEDAAEALYEETRAWRADRQGWVASEMRLWKRRSLQTTYGRHSPVTFQNDPSKARARGKPWMVWASKADARHAGAVRVEDGFLRSRGLGAALVPPLSLVMDDLGIYYDPSTPSRLERLIETRATLRPDQQQRAEALLRSVTRRGLSKYNIGAAPPALPGGHRILVPGQVEDDASLRLGAGDARTNADLLRAARAENPDAVLIYKPHPDVLAGLRTGGAPDTHGLADVVLGNVDPALVLAEVQEVWTITSLMGFEALLRGVRVTTLGAPFYAGWGLTRDLRPVPPRRRHDVTLAGLAHAALIDYPRYVDPMTGRPCPAEVVVERLATGAAMSCGPGNRFLAKLQGVFASYSGLWRRQ